MKNIHLYEKKDYHSYMYFSNELAPKYLVRYTLILKYRNFASSNTICQNNSSKKISLVYDDNKKSRLIHIKSHCTLIFNNLLREQKHTSQAMHKFTSKMAENKI